MIRDAAAAGGGGGCGGGDAGGCGFAAPSVDTFDGSHGYGGDDCAADDDCGDRHCGTGYCAHTVVLAFDRWNPSNDVWETVKSAPFDLSCTHYLQVNHRTI